ncbi:hypothetical protein A499_23392 [Niallia nealsonii AAU1]|nr:hypothetical protein A499_23392 [Niallia nealsonii AAU1]
MKQQGIIMKLIGLINVSRIRINSKTNWRGNEENCILDIIRFFSIYARNVTNSKTKQVPKKQE